MLKWTGMLLFWHLKLRFCLWFFGLMAFDLLGLLFCNTNYRTRTICHLTFAIDYIFYFLIENLNPLKPLCILLLGG